jgi:uncharacterized damage-inducible protein DinB
MLTETLAKLFERDLLHLKKEVNSYADEKQLWVVKEGIVNSAGNLCLHLLGNLNHFIGFALGQTGYVRNRDQEFSARNIPVKELGESIDKTIRVINYSLSRLSDEDLRKNFPLEKHGETVSNYFMLLHLVTHFNYHLGQINYHRRMV